MCSYMLTRKGSEPAQDCVHHRSDFNRCSFKKRAHEDGCVDAMCLNSMFAVMCLAVAVSVALLGIQALQPSNEVTSIKVVACTKAYICSGHGHVVIAMVIAVITVPVLGLCSSKLQLPPKSIKE